MAEQTIFTQVDSETIATIYDSDDEYPMSASSDPSFAKVGPSILAAFHLENAREWLWSYSIDYEWDCHPNYPKKYLIWAEFKGGKYIFHELKVLNTTRCRPQNDELIYAISLCEMSKSYFDKDYGTIDSDQFNLFKQVNRLEETSFFRARMEYFMSTTR